MADLLSLEVDLVYFDTTCTYFELDLPSDEGEPLRRYGHSKDHRPDRPQTVIGLAVTRTGIPIRCWVWPGNTADRSVVEEVKRDQGDRRRGRRSPSPVGPGAEPRTGEAGPGSPRADPRRTAPGIGQFEVSARRPAHRGCPRATEPPHPRAVPQAGRQGPAVYRPGQGQHRGAS